MTEEGKIKIDKFDGHDFGFWKMKIEDEDRRLSALGAARLSLAKNVAYNVVNEKTTYDLFKALSNMYEKPNHVNEFNSILSSLMSVDIKFDDEVQALLLLSSLPESREDIRRKTSGEYSNSLFSAEDKGRGRKQDRGQKHNRSRSKSKKRVQSKNRQDITYIVEPTYAEEELECSGKVRLADDKTLDIAGVGDVKWKATVENETNLQVKCFKSDNGGGYSNREFIEYYAKNRIRMLKTVSETPQQNGVAERMN
ncbi:retrovirus-related pol polyprotein from transposon TNT 1-94 [Tanacetum coccineum]